MSLPKYHNDDNAFNLLVTNWSSQIDPVLNFPINNGLILKDVETVSGQNIINHKLDRKLQGWFIVRQRGNAIFYDNQVNNPLPDKSLWLIASSGITIDLLCF